jgi:lysozyme family protein
MFLFDIRLSLADIQGGYMAEFREAFDFMMSHEDAARSGVVTHDGDGRTRFGICERFYPHLSEAFWYGSANFALHCASAIYLHDYWDKLRLGQVIDQAVASKLFDMAVNMGRRQATIFAQRAAKGLLFGSAKAPEVDGVMGDKTISALNSCPPASLVEALCNLSKIFFQEAADKNPAKAVDLKGWLKRASAIPAHAVAAEEKADAASA